LSPGKFIIGTALGKTIVAHGQNLIVLADNTGAYLGAWILGPLGGKVSNPHKILIPCNIVFSLLRHIFSFPLPSPPADLISRRLAEPVHDSLPQVIPGKAFRKNIIHPEI